MLLQLLDNFHPQHQVVGGMCVDEFKDLLPFIWTFSNDIAVVFEKMAGKKLGEIRVLIFSITLVKLQGKAFAEKQRVRE
jgi:hypothetical protein